MNTLKIDDGLQTFDLGGACEVRFNPSDAAFVQKLYNTMSELAKKDEAYRKQAEDVDTEDPQAVFSIANERDKEMRKLIDGVFNVPVCDKVFADMNVATARGSNGVPVWANMILAIIDTCDASMDGVDEKANATINKYVSKYHKKYHK